MSRQEKFSVWILVGVFAVACANNKPRVINPPSGARRPPQNREEDDNILRDRDLERAAERAVNELLNVNGSNVANGQDTLDAGLNNADVLDSFQGAETRADDLQAFRNGGLDVSGTVTDANGNLVVSRNATSNFAFNNGSGNLSAVPGLDSTNNVLQNQTHGGQTGQNGGRIIRRRVGQ